MDQKSSRFVLAVALITALGAVLRFAGLSGQSLWYDEVYTVRMLQWPLRVILTVRDGHPPLFHLLLLPLHPLLGDQCGRVFSAVVGTATLPLVALLGARLFGRATGTLAGFLLAISPLHVWYSREGRMYALYMLLAVLSSLAVVRVVRNRDLRGYLLWALAVLAGLLTHYGFVAVVLAQVVFIGGVEIRRIHRLRDFAPLAVVISLAVAGLGAMMPLARELAAGPIGTERGFSPLGLPYTAFTFLTGFGTGPTITELHWSRSFATIRPYLPELAAAAVTLVLLAFFAWRALNQTRRWNVYMLLWLCVPPLLLATRSRTTGTSQNVRYVISSLPAFLLLAAHGIRCQSRAWAAAAVALVVGVSALSLQRQYFDSRYHREDVRAAAGYLRENSAAEDRIVISAAEQKLTLAYYLNQNREIEKLPVRIANTGVEADLSLAQWAGRRTWVLLTREWGEDPSHLLRRRILRRQPEALRARFPGVDVFELEP